VLFVRQQHRLRLSRRVNRAGSRRVSAAPVVVAAALLALAAPAAQASLRCTQSPDGVLRITPYENPRVDMDFAGATVRREGNRVLVLDNQFSDADEAISCSGGQPTVVSTKRVVFLQSGLSFGQVQLSGGLPAPRIEFRALRGALAYGTVVGTTAADEWTFGGSATEIDLALDPAEPLRSQIVFDGPGRSVVDAEPHNGDDVVDAGGITDARMKTTILDGGPGDDTLLGSRFPDALNGGKGRDRLEGGGGNDQIRSRDEYPDAVACGAGKDQAKVGNGDTVTGCEKIDRPGQRR
jgi:Ca2+-binding RTX toxin-like protein